MIKQGFSLGERDWYVMAYYNIKEKDLPEVYLLLTASGDGRKNVDDALSVLSQRNTGYTFTNFENHSTVVCIAKATSDSELISTITHEIKHITEHISEYYGIDPKSEKSAYLQGKISEEMYKAFSLLICPKCAQNYKRKCGKQ